MANAKKRWELPSFVRSSLAGGAATLVDLLVLYLGVVVFGLSTRTASLPALLAGGVANFYGNRHFAFRAQGGSLRRQAALYAITEAIALALNAVLYDAGVRALHPSAFGAVAIRLVTTHVVFIAWSYPVWRRVFRAQAAGATA